MAPTGGETAASIVIVTYNGLDVLVRCLEATIEQADALGAEVIVVDNASTDGTAEHLRRHFPSIALVRMQRNVGFAAGCNAGARVARSNRVVLLNNDAIPDPGWLAELLAALAPDDVAVACSVVHDPRFPEVYALGTGSLSLIGHPISRALLDLEQPFYATGCSLVFRRDLLGEPFDPAYFAYYEDVLLSWRARLRGYRVARALESSVQHEGSATAIRMPDVATYFYERNKLLTPLLCYEPTTLARLLPLYLFDSLVRLAEDARLVVTGRATGPLGRPAKKYALVLRGLGWLLLHRRAIARRRAALQATRIITDVAITRMLSAKIQEDYTPTRVHRFANAVASLYCRLVGLETAERHRTLTLTSRQS